MTADLGKPNCAKDFKNVGVDLQKLQGAQFQNLGTITHTGRDPNLGWSGAEGEYKFGQVFLNLAIDWADPNYTPDLDNGQPGTYPALNAEVNYLGINPSVSMTVTQFMDIILIHELAHGNSKIGDTDNQRMEKQLWNDCVK